MLNLTFLFETCGKTEIQFIPLCEEKLCVYSEQYSYVVYPCCL